MKTMKTKKIPMRMCLGCGESKPKKELVRVVKNKEGEISATFFLQFLMLADLQHSLHRISKHFSLILLSAYLLQW